MTEVAASFKGAHWRQNLKNINGYKSNIPIPDTEEIFNCFRSLLRSIDDTDLAV